MRSRDFATALVVTLSTSAAAMAGWNEFWHQSKLDYRRASEWPYPFVCADRVAVQTPLAMMADNGWRRQNTLGGILFNAEGELTTAGMHKVKWIVTQAPVSRRTVWVLRGDNADMTTARIDSVQRYIAQVVPDQALPEVLVTDQPPPGMNGDYLDAIDRSMRSTVPPPRLPAMSTESGGGS
jgi:hypothetical protein